MARKGSGRWGWCARTHLGQQGGDGERGRSRRGASQTREGDSERWRETARERKTEGQGRGQGEGVGTHTELAGGDGQGDGVQTTARDRREREWVAAREAENCHQVETVMRGQEGKAGETARTRGLRAREQASTWQGQESATTDLMT